MITLMAAATTIVWSIETFSSGVMLGIAVYTAGKTGSNSQRRKK